MSTAQESLASAAYAMFALQQPISLPALAEAARDFQFPMTATQTPDWFSAAASGESSLVEMAPELQVLSADLDSADEVDVSGIDLIHVYAPELQTVEDIQEPEPPEPVAPVVPAEQPRTSTQLGLLKELGNLEG